MLATAVHAGGLLRREVAELTALTCEERLREEDPLTDVLASVGDQTFVSNVSRFEVDLNRPTEQAVYRVPDDAWDLELWRGGEIPDAVAEASLDCHAAFYGLMRGWIEEMIDEHGRVLLLDVHSFNHRREDDAGGREPADGLPDIDLGVSTADRERFGGVIDALRSGLERGHVGDRPVEVGENVRFPDGGNWPEWVYAEYGDDVCTITLEYKKVFMDEWTGQADVAILQQLRADLDRATADARRALS